MKLVIYIILSVSLISFVYSGCYTNQYLYSKETICSERDENSIELSCTGDKMYIDSIGYCNEFGCDGILVSLNYDYTIKYDGDTLNACCWDRTEKNGYDAWSSQCLTRQNMNFYDIPEKDWLYGYVYDICNDQPLSGVSNPYHDFRTTSNGLFKTKLTFSGEALVLDLFKDNYNNGEIWFTYNEQGHYLSTAYMTPVNGCSDYTGGYGEEIDTSESEDSDGLKILNIFKYLGDLFTDFLKNLFRSGSSASIYNQLDVDHNLTSGGGLI